MQMKKDFIEGIDHKEKKRELSYLGIKIRISDYNTKSIDSIKSNA